MDLEFFKNLSGKGTAKYSIESYVKKNFIDEYTYIIEFSKQYNFEHFKFQQKLYHTIYNIVEPIKCKNVMCDKLVKFISKSKGYSSYCSKKCAASSDETKKIKKDNIFEKYGVEFVFQLDSVKEKRKKSLIDHYGVDSPMKYAEIRDKVKQTNLEKYGTEFATQNQEIKNKISESVKKIMPENIEKRRKTNLEKYGVEEVLSADIIRDKRKETNLKKYGVEESLAAPSVQQKKRNTNLEKYGVEEITSTKKFHENLKKHNLENYNVEYTFQRDDVKLKRLDTLLTKYGIKHPLQNELFLKKAQDKRIIKFKNIISDDSSIIDFNYENKTIIYHCSNCNNTNELSYHLYYQRLHVSKTSPCLNCNPHNSYSAFEIEICTFLDDLGIIYETHNRKLIAPFELDIYIPAFNLAIEANGVYWHSEALKHKNYHQEKYFKCKEQGIRLIQIWEDDWKYKTDIVKSRLKHILKLSNNRIFARKCKIKDVNNKEYKLFLIENHLQGYIPSKIKLGLYYNDELISVLGIGKVRRALGQNTTGAEYEIHRFCNTLNSNIIGSTSKLFKYFKKTNENINSIISYAHLDWGDGNVYKYLGLKFIKYTTPGYYYNINGIREHRFKWRKDVLVKMGYDINKTESDIMLELGYLKCWDSGNAKWKLIY